MPERVRFSPAPTGALHLGGARTALFNELVARRDGGTFVVRFEDTDAARADASLEPGILKDLAWLGLRWDEGTDVGGPYGPYRQSERVAVYRKALDGLIADGAVYRCFCSEATLASDRAEDAAEGRAPRYRGSCRGLPRGEAEKRAADGETFCWRFAVPPHETLTVDDAVHGAVRFDTADIGDFVVARSDGAVLYDLACAVDDAAMAITLVIRGDDHISNTPRQLLLLRALRSPAPRYAHVPLVMGADGRPLSKSRGAESLASLRSDGFLAAAVVNHLALLGWSDPAGREVMTHDELAAAFELERVSGASPAHDPARLRWLNKRHMAALSPEQRAAAVQPFLPELPGVDGPTAARLIACDVDVAGEAALLVAGIASALPADEDATAALGSASARVALQTAAEVLAETGEPEAVRAAFKAAGLPAKEAMPALRAALTGRAHGLPVATVVALLGVDGSCERIRRALT